MSGTLKEIFYVRESQEALVSWGYDLGVKYPRVCHGESFIFFLFLKISIIKQLEVKICPIWGSHCSMSYSLKQGEVSKLFNLYFRSHSIYPSNSVASDFP